MLDFCLLHYLLSSDSEAMTHYSIHPLLNYLKGNTSAFGSAIQVLPSDIREYLSSFFNSVVVVFISIFIL